MDTHETTRTDVAKRQPADFTDQLIEPFNQLRTEVDRLFERFPFRLPTLKFGRFAATPALDMTETDQAYKISVELPGIDPNGVEVTFDDGLLRITGEKKDEREANERGFHLSERSYGAFERAVALPSAANPEKIDAKFRNGVLTVTIAKDGEPKRNVRKISINKA